MAIYGRGALAAILSMVAVPGNSQSRIYRVTKFLGGVEEHGREPVSQRGDM